jgi:Zn-dependent protease/CBS domain-containing protein
MRKSGFRAGRIFGIDINVDWSWLFILFLVTWNLASLFGRLHPAWEDALRWGTALGAALLFFVSVLAHEMAHSLMAKAKGVSVRDITLFLFGGVSNIQRHPPTPAAEFLIAVVGPITSFVLGMLFIVLSGVTIGPVRVAVQDPTNIIEQLDPITTLLLWLGPINIMVGLFNLIPGFPLDGGRLVRSMFWMMTGSLRKATRWASWMGQGVAWLMILAGISMMFGAQIPFFGTGFGNGLWLAFVGWFLNNASTQSYRQVVIKDVLEGVPVVKMIRRNPPTVSPTCSITDLVHDHVMGTDDHAFPVMENGGLVGIVTLDDIRAVPRGQWDSTVVREIMTSKRQLVSVSPDEEADDALSRLTQRDVRQLPVLQNGQLMGLLRRRDIIQWLRLQPDAE